MEDRNRSIHSNQPKTGTKKRTSNVSYRSVQSDRGKRSASSGHSSKRSSHHYSDHEDCSYTRVPESSSGEKKVRNTTGKRPSKKKKKKGGCLSFLIKIIIILLLAFLGARFVIHAAFQKLDKYSLNLEKIVVNEKDKNIKGYQNIALFGVDSQDNKITDIGSRTDCIIVASIHKRTKKVKLLSIYRDTYVSIDGQYDKINAAYSYGGPELAISTINRNLDLNITDFATVNFKALADAVDILGGIPLTVKSEKELKNLNDYIGNMNKINGGNSPKFKKPKEFPFTKSFDGNQAVAYSRIRYMAGGDHERASHQRIVVEGIVNAAKKKPWKLKSLIDVVLPQCKTSLSASEMTKLSMGLLRYKLVDSQAYPWDSVDEKYHGIYYGFPLSTYSNTIKAHEYLFGTKDYEPTEELTKISEKVGWATDELGY